MTFVQGVESDKCLGHSSKVFLANCWKMAYGFESWYTMFFFNSAHGYVLDSAMFSYTVG